MTDLDNVTVTENDTVTRDPLTGAPMHTIERTVVRRDHSNWGLWIAGIAVFGLVVVLALFLLGRNNDPTAGKALAAEVEADAGQLQAEQAIVDVDAAGDRAASNAAAASASAAAARAAAASAAAAQAAVAPQAPNPADSEDPAEVYPPLP